MMQLTSVRDTDIPYFSFQGLEIQAKITSVNDGDTFTAIFEYLGKMTKVKCRLSGIDTPEMKPPLQQKNREEIRQRAIMARNRLCQLLTQCDEYTSPCDQHHHLVTMQCYDFDKYGRLLVRIDDITERMIHEGYGVPYDGKKKA